MSYDVYVNLQYDDAVIRAIVDRAPAIDFFGDGETVAFPAEEFAAHNDRYASQPVHQYVRDRSGGAENGHGFLVIINRAGQSAALHDSGPGDFDHARQTIKDLHAWLRANIPKARVSIASIASTDGYADYAWVGTLGGWQVTDTGDGLTPTTAAIQ